MSGDSVFYHRWKSLHNTGFELKHIIGVWDVDFVGGKDLSAGEHPRVCLLNHHR